MLQLSHKSMDVWGEGIALAKLMYELTAKMPRDEVYGLTSQIKRSVVSVPSNIAEGASRRSSAEKARFYEIARSSLVELDTQLELAGKIGLVSQMDMDVIHEPFNSLFAKLSKLIEKTRT